MKGTSTDWYRKKYDEDSVRRDTYGKQEILARNIDEGPSRNTRQRHKTMEQRSMSELLDSMPNCHNSSQVLPKTPTSSIRNISDLLHKMPQTNRITEQARTPIQTRSQTRTMIELLQKMPVPIAKINETMDQQSTPKQNDPSTSVRTRLQTNQMSELLNSIKTRGIQKKSVTMKKLKTTYGN